MNGYSEKDLEGMLSDLESDLAERKESLSDRPFDVRPVPSSALTDLNRLRFEDEYLPAAFAPDILAANERSYEQRLAATKMIVAADMPIPTVLGLLVLSPRTRDFIPGAYVQFLRIAGHELADPISSDLASASPPPAESCDRTAIRRPSSRSIRLTSESL